MAADSESELPVAFIVAPANENEKKHAYKLLDKTLRATKGRVKILVADSQYSSKGFRKSAAECGVESVIPYRANQRLNEKGLLRVDKHFRTRGPAWERGIYRRRASVEWMISRLKEHLGLDTHKVKGLRNIAVHVPPCIVAVLLVALAASRLKTDGESQIHSPNWVVKTKVFMEPAGLGLKPPSAFSPWKPAHC
jgi:transposase